MSQEFTPNIDWSILESVVILGSQRFFLSSSMQNKTGIAGNPNELKLT